jgi:Na+/melibiose symporter-like transporter
VSGAVAPSAGQLIRFSAIAVPVAAAGLPLGVYLPAIYARDYGLSLSVIGLVFLFGRLWDAVSDPLIGTLSDATRSKFGRRKPWILAGGILFAACSALLFFPPFAVTPWTLAAVLFFFYLGWTAVQIPFQAWSGEVSGDYHQRTRIATYQQVVASSALLLALILPTIADQFRPADGRLQLSLMGGFILLSIIPALSLTLTALKEPPLPLHIARKPNVKEMFRAIAGEPLLLRVLASDFAVTLAQNIRAALIVFFVSFYMGRPEWAGGLFLFQFVFGVFAGPIWLKIGKRYGKHRTAVAGELVQVGINLALLLVTPESFGLLLALTFAQGLAQGSGNLMLRAIVADVADKHRLESGEDRTGLFFSVFSLAGKSATAAAVGIALPLVSWLGFDPTGSNSPAALNGLLIVFAAGPAIAHALSAALIAHFPLDEAAHAEIRRQLEPGHPDHAFAE